MQAIRLLRRQTFDAEIQAATIAAQQNRKEMLASLETEKNEFRRQNSKPESPKPTQNMLCRRCLVKEWMLTAVDHAISSLENLRSWLKENQLPRRMNNKVRVEIQEDVANIWFLKQKSKDGYNFHMLDRVAAELSKAFTKNALDCLVSPISGRVNSEVRRPFEHTVSEEDRRKWTLRIVQQEPAVLGVGDFRKRKKDEASLSFLSSGTQLPETSRRFRDDPFIPEPSEPSDEDNDDCQTLDATQLDEQDDDQRSKSDDDARLSSSGSISPSLSDGTSPSDGTTSSYDAESLSGSKSTSSTNADAPPKEDSDPEKRDSEEVVIEMPPKIPKRMCCCW